MAQHFQNETVHPWELLNIAGLVIRDAVLERCTVVGPAILYLVDSKVVGGWIKDPSGGSRESVVWTIPPNQTHLVGVVPVLGTTFNDCIFESIGFALSSDEIPDFWARVDGQ